MDSKVISKKKEKVINKDRFLDPQKNKLKLDKYHKVVDKKKSLSSKIRDVKKLITHVESKMGTAAEDISEGKEQLLQAKKDELKRLNEKRREGRKHKFIDKQYKHVKMYESKRLRKQLKKLEAEGESEETEKKKDEVKKKLMYVKFFPRGERYISILKDDTLTEKAKTLREEYRIKAEASYEEYKTKLLMTTSAPEARKRIEKNDILKDKFFLSDDEDDEEERDYKPVENRKEVDRKGNVLKKK